MLLDGVGKGRFVGDLDAPMMDARPRTGPLRLLRILAVVEHQREIELPIGHVARIVAARVVGAELLETKNVLVEFRRLLQVGDLEREMHDARFLALVLFLVAADADDLGHVAVRRAEFQRALLRLGENLTAVLHDLPHGGFAVLHLDAEMMDARAGAGELCLLDVLAVVDHER